MFRAKNVAPVICAKQAQQIVLAVHKNNKTNEAEIRGVVSVAIPCNLKSPPMTNVRSDNVLRQRH